MSKKFFPLATLFLTFLAPTFVFAQAATVEPQTVQVEAADGLTLVGDFYAAPSDVTPQARAPAVLLLHDDQGNRIVWSDLFEPLVQAGYHALAVDLRGLGETGGTFDGEAAIGDVQTWLDWLREQPNVQADGISIIGADVGANLALIGCGNDADCVTAIALSPLNFVCTDCRLTFFGGVDIGQEGMDYFASMTDSAMGEGLRNRPVLLVASHFDSESSATVVRLLALTRGDTAARLYPLSYHGSALILQSAPTGDSMVALIINWLDEHTPQNDA